MISFHCPNCGFKFQVKDEFAGRSTRCPTCKHPLLVPDASLTRAEVPSGEIDGVSSSLAQAGLPSVVVLPPSPVDERLSPNTGNQDSDASARTIAYGAATAQSLPLPVLMPGQCRYALEKEIGRGGMGVVLRGIDRDIRREVAVKFMLADPGNTEKARFVEEAQITGQLEHPNIVPVHELGVDARKRLFFTMKMVKGRSLAEVLQQLKDDPRQAESTWSLSRLLNILVNVCHALGYAHSRHVIHRDLKPANIMVGDFGEVYVMDWGLAKVLKEGDGGGGKSGAEPPPLPDRSCPEVTTNRESAGDLTQDGTILGTPAYMPPEQAAGRIEAVDRRSDIYALGGILYAILTLEPPVHTDGGHLARLRRVMEGTIAPPEKRAPDRARRGMVPRELSAIALKALAKDPAGRYQTVEAFRRDLERFLEGRSVSAKHDSAWETLKKLVKRNKGVSAATAAALVLVIAVVGVAFHFNNKERKDAQAARDKAEDHYAAFLKEQGEKDARTKAAAPAFLRAARFLTAEKQFADALAQVSVALEYDPGQTEGYLLQGQLLIALERYQEAAAPLAAFVEREPEELLARQLAELTAQPHPNKPDYLWSLWAVFDKQKAYPLADRMTHLAERFAGPKKELLLVYRRRIDTAWPGFGNRLTIDRNGDLDLNLGGVPQLRDLTPLQGMKLSSLSLRSTAVADLRPLRDMPLTRLDLYGCKGVKDLGPLQGMKLTDLNLEAVSDIPRLDPLRGMPLEYLNLLNCGQFEDLGPLRGMPLATLLISGNTKLSNIEPLAGLKHLTKLELVDCRQVKDISPLRGLPLTELILYCYQSPVRDLEPLRGMKLTSLRMGWINRPNLDIVKGMPLTELEIGNWSNLRDLEALRGMQLKSLRMGGCKQIKDFSLLKEMPLTTLDLSNCTQIQDLEFVRGLKLRWLNLWGLSQVKDLGPLAGMELKAIHLTPKFITSGMDILRAMKSLDAIVLPGHRRFDPEEFWKRYDQGELRE